MMKRLLVALILTSAVLMSTAYGEEAASTRKIVRRFAPAYPELAKSTGASGTVKLQVTVDRNGSPKSIQVIGGNPVLVRAAEQSVDRWKWAPAPTETVERIELKFQP